MITVINQLDLGSLHNLMTCISVVCYLCVAAVFAAIVSSS